MSAALREQAQTLDRSDPLAALRGEFSFPERPQGGATIYLAGNSLGLMPRGAREAVLAELDDWQRFGVEGHFEARHPWFPYHERFRGPLARLTGALPHEVVAMNSLTVNLHLLMASFYRPSSECRAILIEGGAFPSDLYAVQSQIAWHGGDPERDLILVEPRPGEDLIRVDDLVEQIERNRERLALVLLGAVHYFSGQSLPVAEISAAAHAAGAAIGWDLAHAIGNVPLALHDSDVDFAVWCSYKYLNAGPGAVAGAFVHERHGRNQQLPRLAGWWGNDPATRFRMHEQRRFIPQPSADGWALSNPPILSLAPLAASLELFDRAEISRLRGKSILLTGFLEAALKPALGPSAAQITPSDPAARGAQLSIRVGRAAAALAKRLRERGAIVDVREPDVIRVAPAPLYVSFGDLVEFAELFGELVRG